MSLRQVPQLIRLCRVRFARDPQKEVRFLAKIYQILSNFGIFSSKFLEILAILLFSQVFILSFSASLSSMF